MATALLRLLGRATANLFASLGTTALAVILFSIIIPFAAAAAAVFQTWRRQGTPAAKAAAKAGFTKTAVFALVVWIAVFAWSVASTVYDDHELLKLANRQLAVQHQEDVRETARRTHDLETAVEHERHLSANMLQVASAFSVYRSAIGRTSPCAIKFSATEDIADLAIRVSQLITDVTQCVPTSIIESSFDPETGREARRGMVPGTVVLHARRDAKGVIPLFNELGNTIRTVRSYEVSPGSPVNYIWLQFGSGVKWSSEQQ